MNLTYFKPITFIKKIITCPLAIIIELLSVFLIPIPIIIFGFLRLLAPTPFLKKCATQCIEASALSWVAINHFICRYLLSLRITVIGKEHVDPQKNYLVIANHQSWLDILMLEEALYQRSGASRYFIKKNLLHIPLAGWACHVLYYPSMQRMTRKQIIKYPERRNQDVATTKRACEKLKGIHFKLNNFPEGTRFSKEKQAKKAGHYHYLLPPKTGGIAHALYILQDHLSSILDLTILFAQKPNVVRFFLGAEYSVTVIIKKLAITADLIGNYDQDQPYRVRIQQFVSTLWQQKEALLQEYGDYRSKRP